LNERESSLNSRETRLNGKSTKLKQKESELNSISADLKQQCELHKAKRQSFDREKSTFEEYSEKNEEIFKSKSAEILQQKKEMDEIKTSLDIRELMLSQSEDKYTSKV